MEIDESGREGETVETVENPIERPPTSLKRGVNENMGKARGMAVDGIRFVVMFQNNIAQEFTLWIFKSGVEKFLDEGIGFVFYVIRRINGQDAAFVDDCDAVGKAEGEVAVVRDDERSDVDAVLEVEDFFADGNG